MKTTLCCLLLASAFASTLATFVIGTGTATSSTGTAFVLSANQAAWGVAALAGLAVAKGLLFAAYMHDRANGVNHAKNYARGSRDCVESVRHPWSTLLPCLKPLTNRTLTTVANSLSVTHLPRLLNCATARRRLLSTCLMTSPSFSIMPMANSNGLLMLEHSRTQRSVFRDTTNVLSMLKLLPTWSKFSRF